MRGEESVQIVELEASVRLFLCLGRAQGGFQCLDEPSDQALHRDMGFARGRRPIFRTKPYFSPSVTEYVGVMESTGWKKIDLLRSMSVS